LYSPNKNELDVLLSNGWDRIAYNVLRGLAKGNLKVGFGTDRNSGMGAYSNNKKIKYLHADFKTDPEKFIEDLHERIQQLKPRVYIPTGEEVLTVAKHINRFNDLEIHIPISSYNTLIKLHDKSISTRIASDLGIPIPKTIIPTNFKEISEFIKEFNYPVVIKKFESNSSKGVFFIDKPYDESQFKTILVRNDLKYGEFITQQFVNGTGYGVSALFNKGELKTLFTHKRLRERILTGGPSTLRMSTNQPELEEYAVRLLKSVRFHGVAMVEFKYNEATNQARFVEVNPRFWGSVGLAINSGVNFPHMLYQIAIDGDVATGIDYKIGFTNEWLLGNISAVFNEIKRTKNPLYIKNLFSKNNGFDDFYLDDPKPFFAMIYLIIKRSIRKIFLN